MTTPLPDRVWSALYAGGPSYARALATTLAAHEAAVTGALRALVRRERAAPDCRVGHCVYYRALEPAGPVDELAPWHEAADGWSEPEVLGDGRPSAIDVDLVLVRAADPRTEIEMLVYGNTPVAGL